MKRQARKLPTSADADTEEFKSLHKLEANIQRRGRKDDSSTMTGLMAGVVIAAIIFFIWRALAG